MNFHFINIYHGTFTIKLKFKTYYIKIFKNLKLNLWCKKMGGEGKRDEGGGGWSKICFLSRAKETLMVNLTPKQTNHAPRETAFLCNVAPSPFTIHTIPEFPK